MSLFEWMGELFSRGSYGTVEFGPESKDREPLYLVLLKFALSATLILLIDWLIFLYLVVPTPRSIAIASGCHAVYFLLAYFLRPAPDESNLGLFGSIFDDPFSVSDDFNRWLLMWQVLLLPGRFVSKAVVYLIATVFGLRMTSRRDARPHLPAIHVPRGIRRAFTLSAWSILCIVCALFAHQVWRQGTATKTWQAVEAKSVARWTEGSRATLDDAKMRIEYEVDGKAYSTVQDGYVPDERPTIYVDPENHNRVSLQLGVPWTQFAVLAGLSTVGGLGVLTWVVLTLWPHLASEDHQYAERD